MGGTWRDRTLPDLLAEHGLDPATEEPFPTDGWSGATFGYLRSADGAGHVIKRDSLAQDWLARALLDTDSREAEFVDRAARGRLAFLTAPGRHATVSPMVLPYLGAATDGDRSAILMPDLSVELLAWERPGHEQELDAATVDAVIDALARFHTLGWWEPLESDAELPWCPIPERIALLTPAAAQRYADEGNPVGPIFIPAWEAFRRHATPEAWELVERLTADITPLVTALARMPQIGIHGDLKLSNVAVFRNGAIGIIDWQMVMMGAIAIELGWLLVSNVAVLPVEPDAVLASYRTSLGWHVGRWDSGSFHARTEEDVVGDWDATIDLTWIVGLLLRGWRKGRDTDSGVTLASGVSARDDLEMWSRRAVEAAGRRL
jgi:hypothetical protein